MTAILDFDLNKDVGSSLMDSRLSGKSHFGNKVILLLLRKINLR
jgi:hypothetical protein